MSALEYILLAPFVAAVFMMLGTGKDGVATTRLATVLSLLIAIGTSLCLLTSGTLESAQHAWFSLPGTQVDVSFSLRADGLSTWLVLLVVLLLPASLLGGLQRAGDRMREYAAGLFVLAGCMIGALLVTDLFAFYLFYEAMLLPCLVLIMAFGDENRRAHVMQFVIYTMLGTISLLVAVWYIAATVHSTDIQTVTQSMGQIGSEARLYLFAAFVLAFAVKMPLMPVHSWQAPVYASCPTGLAVLLAGAMAKLGGYGFLRFVLPFFQEESHHWAPVIMSIAAFGVVAGALLALAQTDMKRLLAFSSLSHLGLVVIGIFAQQEMAYSGAIIQMVAHGFSVAALFLLVGWLEERSGERGINDFGGVMRHKPVIGVLVIFSLLASVAMPGTAAFIGEFLLLAGIYQSGIVEIPFVVIVGLSVILGAVYMLRAMQKVLFGAQDDIHGLQEQPVGVVAFAVVPLLALSLYFGFHPAPILNHIQMETTALVEADTGLPVSETATALLAEEKGDQQ